MMYQRKINSNQQIGFRAVACQKPDPSAIILTACHSWLEGAGRRHSAHSELLLMLVVAFRCKQDDDTNIRAINTLANRL